MVKTANLISYILMERITFRYPCKYYNWLSFDRPSNWTDVTNERSRWPSLTSQVTNFRVTGGDVHVQVMNTIFPACPLCSRAPETSASLYPCGPLSRPVRHKADYFWEQLDTLNEAVTIERKWLHETQYESALVHMESLPNWKTRNYASWYAYWTAQWILQSSE